MEGETDTGVPLGPDPGVAASVSPGWEEATVAAVVLLLGSGVPRPLFTKLPVRLPSRSKVSRSAKSTGESASGSVIVPFL